MEADVAHDWCRFLEKLDTVSEVHCAFCQWALQPTDSNISSIHPTRYRIHFERSEAFNATMTTHFCNLMVQLQTVQDTAIYLHVEDYAIAGRHILVEREMVRHPDDLASLWP